MRAWGSLNPPFANVEAKCTCTRSGLTVLVGHPRGYSKRNVEWGWCRGQIVGPETYFVWLVSCRAAAGDLGGAAGERHEGNEWRLRIFVVRSRHDAQWYGCRG